MNIRKERRGSVPSLIVTLDRPQARITRSTER